MLKTCLSVKKFYFISLFISCVIISSCSPEGNLGSEKNKVHGDNVHVISEEKPLSMAEYDSVYKQINAGSKISLLEKVVKKQFLFHKLNGCILIHQSGLNLIKQCYGNTCLRCNEKDEITDKTLFQLASVSKTFTAIATLKLVEENKLALNDSVQKFYPDFPFHGVTIEQMLSHRSGLPNYLYTFNDSSKTAKRPSNQTIMRWFEETNPERYGTPGKGFSYNNSNYAVLGAVIEKVSGKSFSTYLEQNIFRPLNMNHTYVINSIPDSLVKTVGHDRRRKIRKDFNDDVVGDKGIYSSLDDMLKWYLALKKNRILTKEMMKKVFTPRSFEYPGIRNYGLGFRMTMPDKTSKIPKYIYHNGWWKGYSTLFWFDLKTDSLIVILSNERNKSIYKTKSIIEILRPTDLEK